jgi:hypothetical protein
MRHSKATLKLAYELVLKYVKFDQADEIYTINIDDIAEFDIHAMCGIILSHNTDWANEATGCDNPSFEKSMLPSLIRVLSNSTSDNEFEFVSEWKNGVFNYLRKEIIGLLDDALEEYAAEMKPWAA